ncbi:MAG TPA: hypothetical protein VF613_11860 [Longimicrobium sp.]|jgi:hypothetical protein
MINHRCAAGIAAGVLALAMAVGPIQAQQQAPVRVPVSVLQRYVGEYDQNGSTIRVVLSGDTLFREVPGQRVTLVPISETLFRIGPVSTAEFVTDRAGGVTQVVSDGVAFEFRLPRKGSRAAPPPAPPAAAARVPRSVLERYVGTYEFIPGQMGRTDLRVVVRLQGETLIRSMHEDVVLTPISETRFRVGNTSLVTEFVIDEAGVTQVMGSGFQQLLSRLTSKGAP